MPLTKHSAVKGAPPGTAQVMSCAGSCGSDLKLPARDGADELTDTKLRSCVSMAVVPDAIAMVRQSVENVYLR